MANAKENEVVDVKADTFELTIDEFCTRLSATDKRVELIGAFHNVESQAGKVKDTEAAFKKRFDDFAIQPA